jgi:hypothetical protein
VFFVPRSFGDFVFLAWVIAKVTVEAAIARVKGGR